MKYPNPTFLKTASKVKHKRRNRTIVAIVILCLLTAFVLFVLKMANMQKKYKKDFPQLVGMATAPTTTTESTTSKTSATTEETTTEETTTVETTTELVPSFITETEAPESSETSEGETEATTTQDNRADVFEELENNVYFRNNHSLQKVSHDERDQYLDDLKQSLEEYIRDHTDKTERVCIYYANLRNNETMGVNELSPIIPGSAFNLPIGITYCNLVNDGIINPAAELSYIADAAGNSSTISEEYSYGKKFTLRTLAHYAIADNDNTALTMLLSKMGGIDSTVAHINVMSCYVDYSKSVLYTAANGEQMKGKSRSSCYDLVKYAKALYVGYLNKPSVYQTLINDMSESSVPTVYRTAFGEDCLILHCAGRNKEYGAYTDVAIIDGEEPIAVCIYCECASYDRAQVITADMATLVSRYITSLH